LAKATGNGVREGHHQRQRVTLNYKGIKMPNAKDNPQLSVDEQILKRLSFLEEHADHLDSKSRGMIFGLRRVTRCSNATLSMRQLYKVDMLYCEVLEQLNPDSELKNYEVWWEEPETLASIDVWARKIKIDASGDSIHADHVHITLPGLLTQIDLHRGATESGEAETVWHQHTGWAQE